MKTLAWSLFLLCAPLAWGDTIHLKNGGSLEGVILKKSEDGVVVLLKYATVTIGSYEIDSVEPSVVPATSGTARLQSWERCFESLVKRPWGPELHILPARVIESGPLKNVPYVLHISDDYQFALYGDPDAPACLELGISGVAITRPAAQQECMDLMASFLRRASDVEALRAFGLAAGKKDLGGIVVEISRDADSRGRDTWWISVSEPGALDSARVSDKQLEALAPAEAGSGSSSPTLVQSSAPTGTGEKQETITPFGTEPHNPPPRRRSYGGGIPRLWGSMIRWHHGRVSGVKK